MKRIVQQETPSFQMTSEVCGYILLMKQKLAHCNIKLHFDLEPLQEACKRGIHPCFETQSRRYQTSKTGVSVVPQKDWCPRKLKKRKGLKLGLQHIWKYIPQIVAIPSGFWGPLIPINLFLTYTSKTFRSKALSNHRYNLPGRGSLSK